MAPDRPVLRTLFCFLATVSAAAALSIPPTSGSQLAPTAAQLTARPAPPEAKSDRKSDKKEPPEKTPPSPAVQVSDDAVLYSLPAETGGPCIMFSVDGIIEFKYSTTLGQTLEKDTFLPNSAVIQGDCSGDDEQKMFLKWQNFVLVFYFSKTTGGERWYVNKIELKFDSADHHYFEHFKNPGKTYILSSSSKQLLFPTPVGYSFKCKEVAVDLDNHKTTDTTARLLLRNLKLEPFIFKNEFGPEYLCSATGTGSYRSETAPLVVGSLLAATCLITISGYAAFRYFKIKKVQYDTME